MSDSASFLLDANVLIALVLSDHEHHRAAASWVAVNPNVAVCPITEGALVRTLIRLGESPSTVAEVLRAIRARKGTEFWADDVSYADVDLSGIQGHRQVTDDYLVALATHRGARVATFDVPLHGRHPDGTHLVS